MDSGQDKVLNFECEARHGGTPPSSEMHCYCPNLVAASLASVRAWKIPGTVSCGQASFGRVNLTQGIASEGRLAERHTDGGFQPPVKGSNEIWTVTIYFAEYDSGVNYETA